MRAGVESRGPRITFGRLPEVPVAAVKELLNEPRNRRHMPLAGEFSTAATADWIRDKDDQWDRNGYGPWAILLDGEFAGWGGFQREAEAADFALVLVPRFWGAGAAITQLALARGFEELGLTEVTIALPFTRSVGRLLERLGFHADGEVAYGASRFQRYRLSRPDWLRVWPQNARPPAD